MDAKPKIIKKQNVDSSLSLEARLDLKDTAEVLDAGKIMRGEDLLYKQQAESILQKANEEAAMIRERARSLLAQVEEKIKEAKQRGVEEGRSQGYAEVTRQVLEFEKAYQEKMRHLEKDAVKLVYEIAEKIIRDAFKISDEAMLVMIKQALSSSLGNDLTLILNAEDFERLKSHQPTLLLALSGQQNLRLKPSEVVRKNACVIESEMGTIEADLESQLAAIRQALDIKIEADESLGGLV